MFSVHVRSVCDCLFSPLCPFSNDHELQKRIIQEVDCSHSLCSVLSILQIMSLYDFLLVLLCTLFLSPKFVWNCMFWSDWFAVKISFIQWTCCYALNCIFSVVFVLEFLSLWFRSISMCNVKDWVQRTLKAITNDITVCSAESEKRFAFSEVRSFRKWSDLLRVLNWLNL